MSLTHGRFGEPSVCISRASRVCTWFVRGSDAGCLESAMENTHTAVCARVCVSTWTAVSFYSGGDRGSERWVDLSRVTGLVQGHSWGALMQAAGGHSGRSSQNPGSKSTTARRTLKTRHSLDPHLSPLRQSRFSLWIPGLQRRFLPNRSHAERQAPPPPGRFRSTCALTVGSLSGPAEGETCSGNHSSQRDHHGGPCKSGGQAGDPSSVHFTALCLGQAEHSPHAHAGHHPGVPLC